MLSTHVLDLYRGVPAENVTVTFYRDGEKIATLQTNADGRIHDLAAQGYTITSGTYEMHFDIGRYFEQQGVQMDSPFLDVAPIRFLLDDRAKHYHVPLLVSPWGYQMYRGS
jgi:hydroxyisourate hydrolase